MSVYIPTTWLNNSTPSINANNLNHLEAGIASAHTEIENLVSGVTPVGHSLTADHAVTVDPASETEIGGARVWVDSTDPGNIVGYIDAR